MQQTTAQKLLIEKLPSDYFLASTQQDDTQQRYVTSSKGKPLKFLNLKHIKEFFEGEKIEGVYFVDKEGKAREVDFW